MKSHISILLYIVVRRVSGQLNDNQYPIPSYINNQTKVHVKQDGRHQAEHYVYEPPCPDDEDIAPCVCRYDSWANAIDLECSAVESEEQLKQIFKADFPLKNFRKFFVEKNDNIKVLEVGVFNGISFEVIDIINSHLEVIELNALDSCYETVTMIHLVGNKVTSFPFDELSYFSKLRTFDVSGNSLSMIPADAFNGLTALWHLDLSGNTPNIVGTFQDLPNLRDIDLSDNVLTTIPAHFIETGSSHLSVIGLHYNNIVSVEPGAFDIVGGMDIIMDGNSLSTLEEATWRPYLEAGEVLWVNANPLMCGCDIAWLFGEDQLLEQIGVYATCTDGEYLQDLDPKIFDLC
ncbi:unnamed protein product [Meganyctiphanes norvegica]|uniref:Oplophorus-luciferin 2-monooxygenase non-catalytic subunit n=1 Tax=Meganyctiphanes norvegica TaxID=48144 RepID=A0AAV2SMA7_MEGNR